MVISKKLQMALWAAMVAFPTNAQRTDPVVQPDVTQADTGSMAAPTTVERFYSLSELGWQDGLEISGLSGSRELYFPLPHAERIGALELRLPYRSASAFESRRSLTISANGQILRTMALAPGETSGEIVLPVVPTMVRNGFLTVRLDYSGAITEDRCMDQRLAGAFLSFAPEGGLRAALRPAATASLGAVIALLPAAVDIVLPAAPSEAQAAAALTLAAGNPRARIVTASSAAIVARDAMWTRGRIVLVDKSAPPLAIDRSGPVPAVAIGGDDPAAAARLVRSQWRAALAATPSAALAGSEPDATAPDRLTFADLSGDVSVQEVSDRGTWTLAVPAASVPAGQAIRSLAVDAAVADDGSITPPVVSVLMNGLLLGSTEARRGERTRLDLAIPDGLARARNAVEVSVTRQVASGDCTYAPQTYAPQTYPAQILPSSHVRLGPAGEAADFSDLPATFNGGFTVSLDSPQHLAPAAQLLQGLAGPQAPINVTYGETATTGPLVHIGATPPAGTDPVVTLSGERVEIVTEDGSSLVDSATLASLTVAQLLHNDGDPVLWIRPAADFGALTELAEPLDLSYGDIALIGADGIELAFSTERDRLIDIRYPDRTGLAELLDRYRLWLIGLAWLIASVGFIYLLRRVYATRQSDD